MINSKGENIYTAAEIAYELGISPNTVNAVCKRLFGSRINHNTLEDCKKICEYIKSISVEEDAKRIAALHDVVNEVFGGQKLDDKATKEQIAKDLYNVN